MIMAAWKSLVKPIAEFSTSTGLSVVTAMPPRRRNARRPKAL
jgi:hypothetical protein